MADVVEPAGNNNTEEAVSEEGGEGTPSIADIIRYGAPPEYIPLLVLSFIICVFIIVLFVRAVNEHRRFFTKHTMQGLCTLGIVLTFPVYAIMYYSGIIVPRAMAKVTFLAETYEAISLVFFLRLLFTYMGGKKQTIGKLKGHMVPLANPPLCCLICLPHIKFGKKFMLVHELFILQLFIFQLILGYIDLLIGIDDSHTHPASLIEETYSHYFHGFILLSLLLAIYGLGGIYHAAEEQLKHYQIFRKFILYKAFVTVVKVEELLVTQLAMKVIDSLELDIGVGAIPGELRVHMLCYFLVIVQAAVIFPFLLRAYSTADYPVTPPALSVDSCTDLPMLEFKGDQPLPAVSDYVSFPAAQTLEGPQSGGSEEEETTEITVLAQC